MKANPIINGYSWVGILNQFVLQWFFIRLQISCRSNEDRTITRFAFIGPVLPLTGWWSHYIGRSADIAGWDT